MKLRISRSIAALAVFYLLGSTAQAQFTQQTFSYPKLVAIDSINGAFGRSVSLSGNGNTALVGGPGNNENVGAAWVYTRSGGVWSQQAKLVGTDAIGRAAQGNSVSLSSDGNTAIVGGSNDNNPTGFAPIGAAWVFTRSGEVWNQQAKLVGTGAAPPTQQGVSVSLSSDGNTAIVGGFNDNNTIGAAWVFARSGGVWNQQAKLVGTGAIGAAYQGVSVSLSGNGNTALVGGPQDNDGAGVVGVGAAWVYGPPVFAGTPGNANCYGQSVSARIRTAGSVRRPQRWAFPT
jgi:hypothetical protein